MTCVGGRGTIPAFLVSNVHGTASAGALREDGTAGSRATIQLRTL